MKPMVVFEYIKALPSASFYLVVFLILNLNHQWLLVSAGDDDENIDPRKDPLLGADYADNVQAFLYVGGTEDMNEFSWKAPQSIEKAGFNQGKKYRWLFHDWCGNLTFMLPIARAFKQTFPDENIILIDFSKPKVATFDGMKSLVKTYAVQSLNFLYAIFDTVDQVASDTDVRSSSHAIGFGFGAIIAAWFGAAAAQPSRNFVNQLGYPFKSEGVPYVFRLPRLTILDPVGMCVYTEEENSGSCPGVSKWPQISISSSHSVFTDAIYSSKASIPTLCPRDAGMKRIAHHRGVYFNEDTYIQPECSEDTFAIPTICTDLAQSCNHNRAVELYSDVIPILGMTHNGCDGMVGPMFGESDPNIEGTMATNFHVNSKDPHPFSKSLSCSALSTPRHPDYSTRYPECQQQNVVINPGLQWEVKTGGSGVGTVAPRKEEGFNVNIPENIPDQQIQKPPPTKKPEPAKVKDKDKSKSGSKTVIKGSSSNKTSSSSSSQSETVITNDKKQKQPKPKPKATPKPNAQTDNKGGDPNDEDYRRKHNIGRIMKESSKNASSSSSQSETIIETSSEEKGPNKKPPKKTGGAGSKPSGSGYNPLAGGGGSKPGGGGSNLPASGSQPSGSSYNRGKRPSGGGGGDGGGDGSKSSGSAKKTQSATRDEESEKEYDDDGNLIKNSQKTNNKEASKSSSVQVVETEDK